MSSVAMTPRSESISSPPELHAFGNDRHRRRPRLAERIAMLGSYDDLDTDAAQDLEPDVNAAPVPAAIEASPSASVEPEPVTEPYAEVEWAIDVAPEAIAAPEPDGDFDAEAAASELAELDDGGGNATETDVAADIEAAPAPSPSPGPETAPIAAAIVSSADEPTQPPPTTEDDAEARTVAAAAELVTLLAHQRSLLDAMARLTGDALEARLAPGPDPHPLPSPPAAPQTALPLPIPPAAQPRPAMVEQERSPMIIERAHAAQRNGETVFDAPYEELPSRLPAFATGFALAMLTGGALYLWRVAG